jgi:enoyl-CoA hydratase
MSELIVERAGRVLSLTLNRPDKMNALSGSLVEALLEEITAAETRATSLLILQGAGRNFSAGFDFGDFENQAESDLVLRFIRIEQLLQAVYHAPFDTLALAHGKNFGAGVDLVCSCARRVATQDASFQMPGLRFGLVLGTRRYAARVGAALARRVLQEGIAFGGNDAIAAGFLAAIHERNDWPSVMATAAGSAELLVADVQARLFAITGADTRDADLAELVRSAAQPGLKARIRAFRSQASKVVPSTTAPEPMTRKLPA